MVITQKEIKKQLIEKLPSYERKSQLINEILDSISKHFFELNKKQLSTEQELFIDTATESIKLHARDLNVSVGSALSLPQQRELITAYFRAANEQTTDETLKSVASSFTGGLVEITPTTKDGSFQIKFVDTLGIPNNIEGLRNALNVIIPAHLEFIFAYSYLLIRDISKMSINEIEEITLDKFAGGKYK